MKRTRRPYKFDPHAARAALATRLREARVLAGLPQRQAADQLGIPRPAISWIESGQRRVGAVELFRLAHIYGKTVEQLLGRRLISWLESSL